MSGATTISMAAAPMKSAGDRGGAPAGVAELQRDEHRHDAEEQRRQHHQPERPEDERLPDGAEQRARRLRLGGDRRRAERPDDQHDGHAGDARRTPAGCRPPPQTRPAAGPSSAPKMAAPIAVPSISPRRSRGVPATSQASAPAQESALPNPCASRAIPSSTAESAKPKRDARHRHQHEAGEDRPAGPEARGRDPARDRADQRARARRRRRAAPPGSWRARTRPRSAGAAARAPRRASCPRA